MSVGIIAEYNPFHNGHLYHLKKIKEMYPNEEIILVMSGNFTERGEVSIIDKWKKTEIALKTGIDLIVELPFTFATQSADYFSYGALTILEKLHVDKFVFGSETNDIDIFKKIATCQINNPEFDNLVKLYLKFGDNYPTALSKSLEDLTGMKLTLPNDLLGISYVKIIEENNYKIEPICIKRTNNYSNKELTGFYSSGTAVREALKNKENIDKYVPNFVISYLEDLHFQDDYFKLLKYKIMTEDDLSCYHSISEGIDKKIKKEIINSKSYDELINKVKSKRYTYVKVSRILNYILCNYKKEIADQCKEINYIRILGFNSKGKSYLNKIKKLIDIPIISKFPRNKSKQLDMEFISTCVYASTLSEDKKIKLIQDEYKRHPNIEGENI